MTPSSAGAAAAADDVESVSTASYAQRSMWAFALRFRAAHLNELIVPWRLRGRVDVGAMRGALSDLVRRHPTLRARLSYHGGQLHQLVIRPAPLELPTLEVEGATVDERLAAALAIAQDSTRQPLDVLHGPTLVACLVRLAPDDHLLCLRVHHAMCDGQSLQIMQSELAAFYGGRVSGTPPRLPALSVQAADIAHWEASQYAAGGFDEELRFWRSELENPPPPLALPAIAPRKGNRDWRARALEAERSGDEWKSLTALATRLKVSPFALCLSAFAVLLRQRTGQEDMVLGVPTLNRWSEEAMRYVGYATSLMPVRLRPLGPLAFDVLCTQARTAVRRMLANGRVPLELLLRETPLTPTGHTVFPVWCQLQEQGSQAPLEAAGLSIEMLAAERDAMLAELDVDLYAGEASWRAEFGYRTALFEPATVQRLLDDYGAILDAVQRNPSASVAELGSRLSG